MDTTTRDVTDDEGTKGLEATFHVDAAPEALLEVVWSPENFIRLFPDVKEVRVVAGEGNTLDVEYRVDAVIREFRYVLRRTLDRGARTITWHEIGGDLKRVRGGWTIVSDGAGGSRATYRAFVAAGMFVPTGLLRDAARRKLGEMVARVRSVGVELCEAGAGPQA